MIFFILLKSPEKYNKSEKRTSKIWGKLLCLIQFEKNQKSTKQLNKLDKSRHSFDQIYTMFLLVFCTILQNQ